MSLSFNWFHRTNHDASVIVNRAVDPVNDWSPLTITDPLTGSATTIYNLNKNAFGRPTDFYQTNDSESKRKNIYTGYEVSFVGRMPHRGTLIAAYTIDRVTDVTCSAPIGSSNIGLLLIDGNNVTNTSLNDPNSLRYCDERGLIPFRGEVKIIGNMPIWKGFEASVVYQNAPEFLRYVNWDITKATRYPADCSACPNDAANPALKALVASGLTNTTERVALSIPGSRYNDRLNQLDIGIRRNFVFREKYRLQAQAEVFNVTNSNAVLVQNQTLGNSIAPFVPGGPGGKPTQILQARLLRLAVQFHF